MEVVATLIQKGANVNIRNKNNDGALEVATAGGNIYNKKGEKILLISDNSFSNYTFRL